ncbi:MAG: hypothetical protein HZB83_07050, partial [Deltaproteobacteria bacterium]|nr:hypothetical protein [Deltaproteobacteria bacterium]
AEALITSDGTRIYSKTFEFRGNGYEEAGVYLGDILPEGARVRQFAVDFYADDVSIRAIRLEEPTLWQTVGAVNRRFWEPEEASIGTVNFIDSPDINGVSFLAVLYGVTAVVFSAAILFLYLKRGRVTGQALIKYMAFAFLASGLLFSVRMDYNWLHAARSDLNNLTGNTMRGRISTVYKGGLDDFLNFMDLIKKTIPENGVVKAAAKGRYGLYSTLGSYYLLPLRTSGKADYLWTYMDSGLRFSQERRALLKGDEVAAWPIRLVMEYGPDAAIYRIEKD